MKKYDVVFRANRVRYIERIEASTKESAKNKMLKKYNDIEKITRVKEARYDMLLNEIEFELSNNERWICPKCNRECYEYPALSRKDNETEICPRCGIKEAMEDFINE